MHVAVVAATSTSIDNWVYVNIELILNTTVKSFG